MLSLEHEDMLVQGSGISQEIVAGRDYESLEWTSKEDPDFLELKNLNFDTRLLGSQGSGLLIPMYGVDGSQIAYQWRPDTPIEYKNTKTREIDTYKYLSTKGNKNRLDVHPTNTVKIKDVTIPIIITEGVKKSDSLTSRGQCVIAITGVYNWLSKYGTLGDWEDVPLKEREVTILFDSDTHDNVQIAKSMVRLGNFLKYKQVKKVNYLITPKGWQGIPTKGVDDFFVAGGTWNDLKQDIKTQAPDTGTDSVSFSDYYLAELAVEEVFEGRFCWTDDRQWMEFDGKRWDKRNERAALAALAEWASKKYEEAQDAFQSGQAKHSDVLNWAKLLGAKKLLSVLRIAESLPGVYKKADEAAFDYHHDLLNCPNGVVDLQTGQLLPHDPEYMMTKITKVGYYPGKTHKYWDAAVTAIPEDCLEWAQIRFGQGVSGRVPDDLALVVMYGGTAENGKTSLFEGIKATLGDYARVASSKVLLSNRNEHPTEVASLEGLRFAYLDETSEAGRLNVTRVKDMTGPFISARKMRQDDRAFENTVTLFLATNFVPTVVETDEGSWRRLHKLDFPYKFRKSHEPLQTPNDRPGIGDLKAVLRTDPNAQEAVLAWLVEGAKKWYANSDGIGGKMPEEPQRVKASTLEWRGETDMVLKFFNECLIIDEDATVATQDLVFAINEFLQDRERASAWSEKLFTQRFQNHRVVYTSGIEKGRFRANEKTSRPGFVSEQLGKQFAGYKGIRFRTKADEEN